MLLLTDSKYWRLSIKIQKILKMLKTLVIFLLLFIRNTFDNNLHHAKFKFTANRGSVGQTSATLCSSLSIIVCDFGYDIVFNSYEIY